MIDAWAHVRLFPQLFVYIKAQNIFGSFFCLAASLLKVSKGSNLQRACVCVSVSLPLCSEGSQEGSKIINSNLCLAASDQSLK